MLHSSDLACPLNGLIPISNIGYLENIGSLSYAGIPNVDTTYDIIVLVHSLSYA